MKKTVKKTVAKKPATKMQDGGDTTKFYKTNRRGKSKEITREKYIDKVMKIRKPGQSKTTVTNNPETTNYVFDEKGSYPITSPANTRVRTTKTKGLGKGKSVSRVDPLEKQKKGGVIKKTTAKKYQDGGSTNAKKVAANKKKVEANRKKVEANREKVILGKYSPNSNTLIKDGFMGSNNKGDLDYKVKYSQSGPTVKRTQYDSYPKPRVTESKAYGQPVTKATSMDTTGYAAGKKTFVKNEKVKVGPGNMYKQTSKKVERKDVPKELKKMQTMKKGGVVKKVTAKKQW